MPQRRPWTKLRTPVCLYPIIVSHLSFNFLCLLLLYSIYLIGEGMGMGRRPLPAVRDFTHDDKWSTYDISVLKKMCVGGGGRCAQTGHPLKLPLPTKLARLDHFSPASQAGRLAGLMFYVYVFSLV
jgi:hypothetical protein